MDNHFSTSQNMHLLATENRICIDHLKQLGLFLFYKEALTSYWNDTVHCDDIEEANTGGNSTLGHQMNKCLLFDHYVLRLILRRFFIRRLDWLFWCCSIFGQNYGLMRIESSATSFYFLQQWTGPGWKDHLKSLFSTLIKCWKVYLFKFFKFSNIESN